LRPNTATQCPHSITSFWPSANFQNAGDATVIRVPLSILAVLFDRLGLYEPAATIVGFALSLIAAPEIRTTITHLRGLLGDAAYDSLFGGGGWMTTAEMVTYVYDQIDQARTELNAVSK
jgi:hypothetical protein